MHDTTGRQIVTVFGSAEALVGSEQYELARAVGHVLACQVYGLSNGGYGGTMEASARGAKEAGGLTVGVTCSKWKSRPNAYIDRVEQTCDLPGRLDKLISLGSGGYVVLPGATGTLVELAMVWELMAKRFLPVVPIVCVGEFWRPVVDLMASARAGIERAISIVDTPQELRTIFPPVRAEGNEPG
jgi:uncharacterized protein (TIGR00725 family)